MLSSKNKKEKHNSRFTKIIIILSLIILLIEFLLKFKGKSKNYRLKHKSDYKSNTKVAMCTIAKKENRYIKYFVEFYKKLNYDHIYFYDNNDPGDEAIDNLPIVKEEIKNGYITVFKYRPKKNIL